MSWLGVWQPGICAVPCLGMQVPPLGAGEPPQTPDNVAGPLPASRAHP